MERRRFLVAGVLVALPLFVGASRFLLDRAAGVVLTLDGVFWRAGVALAALLDLVTGALILFLVAFGALRREDLAFFVDTLDAGTRRLLLRTDFVGELLGGVIDMRVFGKTDEVMTGNLVGPGRDSEVGKFPSSSSELLLESELEVPSLEEC